MFRYRALRQSTPLRVLALVVFVLALILQPVLASVGEVHELAHDPSGLHSHPTHSNDPATHPALEDTTDLEQEQDGKTLHLLLDFAHCCGQTAGAFLPLAKAGDHPSSAVCPLVTQAPIVLPTRLFAPFRPPIFA